MADPRPGSGAARRRRQQAQRATARHVGWLVGLSQAIRSHHTWEGGDTAAAVGVKPPPWRGRTAAPRPCVRAPCRLWRQLTLAEAWARARRAVDAAGQLPEGAPTVEVAEALLLGGGVSRPPACRSSFGIEIGFIDNVDMVKTNEKGEVVVASAAPAGVSSSHSADETVGASCPQAGFGGRSHADAAASGSEDAILKRGAKDIRTAFQYRHLIKEIYLKIAPKEWHQGGESMLDSWKGQERTLYLEMCRRIKVQPLSHEAVMKSIGVSSAGRVSARGSTS